MPILYLHFDNNHNNHHNIIINNNHNKVIIKLGWVFKKRAGSCFKPCKASVTASCPTFHFNFRFSDMSILLQGRSWLYKGSRNLTVCPLSSLPISQLSSGLVKIQNARSSQTENSSSQPTAQAWISTGAQGSLYRLHIYMVKIETHGITCICKFANRTGR